MRIIAADAHPPFGAMDVNYLGSITAEIFFNRLNRAGIDAAWGTLTLPEGVPTDNVDRLAEINNTAYILSMMSDGRYLPGIWVHPDAAMFCCGFIAEYSAKGVKLVGDIQPEWIEADSDGLHMLLSSAQRNGMTVNLLHKNLEQVEAIAARYPDLKLLVGGRGSRGAGPLPSIELMNKCPNVYLIASAYLGNYLLHNMLCKLPAERVLFGAPYPFCNPAACRAAAVWELRDTADDVREAVLGGNALRLAGKGGAQA